MKGVPWWKLIWFPIVIPSIDLSFIGWLALKNRLATRARMLQWGPQGIVHALFCIIVTESRSHLFEFFCTNII